MPLEEINYLLKESVLNMWYHARMAGFDTLGHAFLSELRFIPNKHLEICDTICRTVQSPDLDRVQDTKRKNKRLLSYTKENSRNIVKTKVKKSFPNLQPVKGVWLFRKNRFVEPCRTIQNPF